MSNVKIALKEDVTLGLDDIYPDPGQPRKNKPIEYLRELGESIKNNGQRNRIHVWKHPDQNGYRIMNGECRWTACVLVGLETIDATIFHFEGGTIEETEAFVFEEQIMDNVVRKNMDPLETLQSYQTAIDMGATIDSLAKKFGVSTDLIEKDLPILGLPKMLLQAYDRKEVPKEVARRLAELPTHRKMLKAWEWAQRGKNTKGMIKKIDAYVAASSQGKIEDLFAVATESATNEDRRAAKAAAGKLVKAISQFSKSPFANGKGPLMLAVNSQKIGELEMAAKEMSKIGAKIMNDIAVYRARDKHTTA